MQKISHWQITGKLGVRIPGDVAIVDAIDPVTTSGPGACKDVRVGTVSGGGGQGGKANLPKGKVRAKLGGQLRLIVGNGRKGAAAPQRLELKRMRLLLGSLYATKRLAVVITARTGKGRSAVVLGRRKVVVPKNAARQVVIKLNRRALRAVKRSKRVAVRVTFRVGKKNHSKAFRIAVKR